MKLLWCAISHFLKTCSIQRWLGRDPEKINLVSEWPTPTDVGQVGSFVGLVKYFKRFINDLSTVLVPLTNLTKKNTVLSRDAANEAHFQEAPIMAMPSLDDRYSVYTNASIYRCGGVIMKNEKPVAYYGRKFDKTMTNWTQSTNSMVVSMQWKPGDVV